MVQVVEVVVPVIKLKRERKDESRVVEAELLRVPAKITTGKLSFGLFQLEAVQPKKRLPLQLRIGLYAKADGALHCAHRTVLLDSAASEARQRNCVPGPALLCMMPTPSMWP